MKKLLYLLICSICLCCLALCALSGCSDGEEDKGGSGDGYTVTVICTDGIEVTSQNPQKVEEGGKASFTLSVSGNIAVQNVSAGKYNYSTGVLTVDNVSSDLRVTVTGETVNVDTSVICDYMFMGKGINNDSSSRQSGKYSLGVNITVNAGDEKLAFIGWSAGATLGLGGTLLSSEREYTFMLTSEMLKDGKLYIYSNYSEGNAFYYDLNGGEINTDAANMISDHYTVEAVENNSSLLKVSLAKSYFDKTKCASTFYDDGIFKREGYILTEYNTKADGSGEGYSLGSKFPLNLDSPTLYCIWSKDTSHADFEYDDIIIPLPAGVSLANAPHWVSNGIRITSYKGDDTTVVIPEKIDGKTVISIASGAFVGKSLDTLVMGRRILRVEDGAFVGCSSLRTVYYPDGIYDITNDAFDSDSWDGVKNFYVNATLAPRFSRSLEGAYALKLSRLLYYSDRAQIVIIAGSSAFQGLASAYLEALLDYQYSVVNFGTTRTTQGYMYLEAMGQLTDENDILLFAPENSAYMMGEPRLYWKTLRDLEGMYNIFRHIDISGYDNVLGAFAEFNKGDPNAYEPLASPRYSRSPQPYELIVEAKNINEYGEYQLPSDRGQYVNDAKYQDVYKLTFNNRFKSIKEGAYMNSDPNEDYYTSENWCDITDPYYKDNLNRAIRASRSGGAKVYFSFCPSDGLKLSEEVKAGGSEWLAAYERLIKDNYEFDGLFGRAEDYIYHHNYFYNNAFHLNDYGRTVHTYNMYLDFVKLLGISSDIIKDIGTVEESALEGCLFDSPVSNTPKYSNEEYFAK